MQDHWNGFETGDAKIFHFCISIQLNKIDFGEIMHISFYSRSVDIIKL